MAAHNRVADGREAPYSYQPPPLPTEKVKLAALSARFPEFAFFVTFIQGRRCYQAERVLGDAPLLSVAGTSTIELWRTLRRACE